MTADRGPQTRPVVGYAVAIGMLVLAGSTAVAGVEWPLSVGMAALGVFALISLGRPLYRVAVYRTDSQTILCRFIAWYHATYVALALFPIIGIAFIAESRQPDSPFWLYCAAIFILLLGIVFGFFAALMTVGNRLWITPMALELRTLQRRRRIPRERIEQIAPRILRSGTTGNPVLHVDISYTAQDGTSRTYGLIDTQFSVYPAAFLAALQMWHDTDPSDPRLTDRIDALLRGQVG